MHPKLLRELADTIVRLLMIIFESSWQSGEVPEDWKKANVIPIFRKGKTEDPGNYWLFSLTLVPRKVKECLILEAISIHMDDKRMVRSQHGFMKGSSCLTALIVFYDETATWMDEGRAVDIVYLNFSKAFDILSCNILIGKFRKCGLHERTVR
ncbi:RNA-directed DNA polymerase from mobile element jockey-like protein [Pitangus sulphuratus]|nr:RNA-directed DNA polymerase from mobile element jockey-like protein [Pitangus sulphuratus]